MAETRRVSQLPEEMIFKILMLLPVVSLLRCRLVCKLWESIISDPKISQAHFTLSQKNQQPVPNDLLVVPKGNDRELYLINSTEDVGKIRLPSKFNGMNWFICSCDGLVTIANTCADVIYLLNPLIMRSRKLPTPKIQAVHRIGVNLAFGFDSISNDYKILRMVLTRGSDNILNVIEGEVYSANAESWKEIQVPKTLQGSPFIQASYVQVQTGGLYLQGSPGQLLSFDLHNEMFGVYPYPRPEKLEIESNVLDFEGSVGMIFKPIFGKLVLSLWTLDDVCGMVSWTKKFNIEPDLEINRVCLYSGGGQFVALNYIAGYNFYDYMKKETKKFPLPASFTQVHAVIKYTKSLVSLGGFGKVD